MVAGCCQEALEALACLHVMAELELLQVEVFPLQTLLLLAVPVASALARQPEPLAVQAACPALLELQALRLLRVGCLGKAAVVAAVVLLARAVQAVLAVVALVAVAVALVALHTRPALVA